MNLTYSSFTLDRVLKTFGLGLGQSQLFDRMNPPQATPLEWQWLGGFLKRLQPAEWRSCHNITHVVTLVQVSHP
jgi:hypothetical protein